MKKVTAFMISLFLICSCSTITDSKLSKMMSTQVDKTYYPDGSLRGEETRIHGMLEGPTKSYYQNGQLKEDANYTGNLLEGPSKTYYESGALKEENNWVQGQLNGPYILYCENGNIKEKHHYKSGKLHGKREQYYDCTTTLSETRTYVDGVLEGAREIYYPDGKPKEKMIYENGNLNGLKVAFYPDGNKKEEEPYLNGKYNGTCRYYFPKGTIMLEVPYVNAQKHGIEKLFYKRGNIQKETPYENGRINGAGKQYAGSGYLWLVENYKNGKLHGKSIQYSKSGRVIKQVNYKNEEWENQAASEAQYSALKAENRINKTMASPVKTDSEGGVPEAVETEPKEEVYTSESGHLLRYRMRKGKMWHYETLSKAHAQSGHPKYGMDLQYGIEAGTDTIVQSKFSVDLIKENIDKSFLARVSLYDMNLEIRTHKGKPEVDCSNVIERDFNLTLSPIGKELKISGIEGLNIVIRTIGKEDQTIPLQDFLKDIFLDLPEKPVKVGEGWNSKEKVESKTNQGFDQVAAFDNSYVLDGFEKINDRECLKIKGSIKGKMEITGKGSEDEAIRLIGVVDGVVVVHFDHINGEIIKAVSESSFIGKLSIRPRSKSEFEEPYKLTRKSEMALIQ